jgi:hypothetical protein
VERIRGQENHLAQILNEPNERSSQRVKKSSEHCPDREDRRRKLPISASSLKLRAPQFDAKRNPRLRGPQS